MKRLVGCLAVALLASLPLMLPAAEPLATWRDTPAKQRIIDFVTAVTTADGSGYVTPADRIAVFDDDGVLWPEKPRVQGMFALQALRAEVPDHPQWRLEMPYKAALELGGKYLQEASGADVFQLVAAAFAGRTQDDFRTAAREFLANARHPRFGRPYTRLGYEPMQDLLGYLRVNGFRIFIVTAGSSEFTRALAGDIYGIPADDVIGSSVGTTLREEQGQLVVRRLDQDIVLVDGPGKPLAIDRQIGKRPILAVGRINAGSDIDMLRYGRQPGRPGLQVLIQHDDFDREYAYDEADKASNKAANAGGWLTVSMRFDWLRIFNAD